MWYTQAIEPTGRREPQWQTSTSSRSSRTTPTTSSCPSSTAAWSAVLRGRPGSRHPGPLPHPSGRLGQGRVRGRRAHLRGRAGRSVLCRPSQLIRYTADEAQPWEYSWVGFNGACAHKLAAQLPFTDAAPVHHTQDLEGMRAALSSIYSSAACSPRTRPAMVAISTSSSPL